MFVADYGTAFSSPADSALDVVHATCRIKNRDTLDKIYRSAGKDRINPEVLRSYRRMFPIIAGLNPHVENWQKLSKGQLIHLFFVKDGVPSWCQIRNDKYTVDKKSYRLLYQLVLTNDRSLSEILSTRGIGGPETIFRLYGPNGFVARNKLLNRHVRNWTELLKQTPLIISFPDPTPLTEAEAGTALAHFPPADVSEPDDKGPHFIPPPKIKDAAPPKEKSEPQVLTKKQKVIVAKPEKAKIEDLVALPPEEIKKIDRTVIKEKLSADKIAELRAEDIEKIPKEIKEEKAWEFSLLDSFDSNMDKFVESAEKKGVSGYLGLRVAQSLVYSDPLLREAQMIGLLFEGRGEWTYGMRLYLDRSSEARVKTADGDQSLSFQRILAAWAYAIKVNKFVDVVHITPRIGTYSLSARIPAEIAPNGTVILRDFSIDNALALGLELDVEWTSFFYILRGWYAQDFSAPGKLKSSVSSNRFGFDAFLKGGGFSLSGKRMSLSYLFFLANEQLNLSSASEEQAYTIALPIPYIGTGVSMTW